MINDDSAVIKSIIVIIIINLFNEYFINHSYFKNFYCLHNFIFVNTGVAWNPTDSHNLATIKGLNQFIDYLHQELMKYFKFCNYSHAVVEYGSWKHVLKKQNWWNNIIINCNWNWMPLKTWHLPHRCCRKLRQTYNSMMVRIVSKVGEDLLFVSVDHKYWLLTSIKYDRVKWKSITKDSKKIVSKASWKRKNSKASV